MSLFKEKMSSYVDRGNKLIAEGKTAEAMKLVSQGLTHYTEKIVNAVSPYAKADAGLIVLVLRHLADEVERNNPGAKDLYEGMKNIVGKPELKEKEKIKKTNRS